MTHVFISYSHEGSDYAKKFAAELERRGFEVWMDERIGPSDEWFPEIEKALLECSAFTIVMTPRALESKWVRKEIHIAIDEDKPIFPLLLEGKRFNILADVQYGDVRGGKLPAEDFFERLNQDVTTSVSTNPTITSFPTESLTDDRQLQRKVRHRIEHILRGMIQESQIYSSLVTISWSIGKNEIQLTANGSAGEFEVRILSPELLPQELKNLEGNRWEQNPTELSVSNVSEMVTKSWRPLQEIALPKFIALDLLEAFKIISVSLEDVSFDAIE